MNLEVLDWGGSGRPVVLLAGLGGTAHAFTQLAPKLAASYHVYSITRRGFGASTHPTSGYSADRLGDDVLAVVDSLRLVQPVLAGHSLAGEELSSIGSRHPEKVAGLVYLDAGYPYAFYNRERGDYRIDLNELERALVRLQFPGRAAEDKLISQVLDTELPAFERSLRAHQRELPPSSAASQAPTLAPDDAAILQAINAGRQRYTEIRSPVLAIFALPHRLPPQVANDSNLLRIWLAAESPAQAEAFERGVPNARVVRIPNADHNIFVSNESDVLREMRAFIDGLPRGKQ